MLLISGARGGHTQSILQRPPSCATCLPTQIFRWGSIRAEAARSGHLYPFAVHEAACIINKKAPQGDWDVIPAQEEPTHTQIMRMNGSLLRVSFGVENRTFPRRATIFSRVERQFANKVLGGFIMFSSMQSQNKYLKCHVNMVYK